MKPLQIEGPPDEEDLVWVQNALLSGGLPPGRVIRNGYLFYHDERKEVAYSRDDNVQPMWEKGMGPGRWITHHPDIMVIDKRRVLRLIIEIDGSAHDDRPGRRRTYKRDKDYEEMKIDHFIKINKGEEEDWHQAVIDHIIELEQTTDIFAI